METVERYPYWRYDTVGDNRVRSSHAALDGKVLRADDPWWKTHYPPWDWGCRCIVTELSEGDVEDMGLTISKSEDMPMPGHSKTFMFDPTNASIDIDMLHKSYDSPDREPDWKLFAAKCRQATVQANGREPETMWELMLDGKMRKTAQAEASSTAADGKERALVLDFDTGKKISEAKGDASSVRPEIPEGRTVCTLHTHPTGDNTPSPADMLLGFAMESKADYIAAGKQLRRWQWLKTPTPEDAKRIRAFDADNNAGRIDVEAWTQFLNRLAETGYIKMEELP